MLTDAQVRQLVLIRHQYEDDVEVRDGDESVDATERDLEYFDRLMAVLKEHNQ